MHVSAPDQHVPFTWHLSSTSRDLFGAVGTIGPRGRQGANDLWLKWRID